MISVSVSRGHAELFDRFCIEAKHGTSGYVASAGIELTDHEGVGTTRDFSISSLRVIDVNPVESDIGLVGACPRNIPFPGSAGLQTEQIIEVLGFERKLSNLLRDHVVA